MAVEVRLTKRFQRSFEKLDSPIQARVKEALRSLYDDPHAGKPLKGDLHGEWSLRVGDYRILYTIDGPVIWVETVRHRREVYR